MMSKAQNTTEMVRSYAAVNGTVKKKDARQSLGLTVEQISYAFATLVKQRYLRKIKHGLYQFWCVNFDNVMVIFCGW